MLSYRTCRLAAALLLLATAYSGPAAFPSTADAAAAGSQSPWRHYPVPASAPESAPNILIVLTDDVGFGSSSTFGGVIPTPNLDRLAEEGLRYTHFHTTAMCSPTRASLLTGRNHHAVNTGAIGNLSLDRDGYTSVIPPSAATIGRVLRENGYHTAWIGKNHNTPLWEEGPSGPFDRWPNGFGFDYFYGFNGSQTNQFRPALIENRNRIAAPGGPDYILERDLADRAIAWLRRHRSEGGNAPFLLYYAPGAAHAPLQAPREWRQRFRGRFDAGWDALREAIFARQVASGILPRDAELTPRPAEIPAWSSLDEDERRFSVRLMEAFAAMLAYSDDQFGRLVQELKASGRFDDTLILFIQGDNGAAAESLLGEFNEIAFYNQVDTRQDDLARFELVGGRQSQPVNAAGWAWAMNSPFQWSKQVASHFGGTRNGMVVSWPKRIVAGGGLRPQFHHVVDIAPTLYEAAGIAPPAVIDGVQQQPFDGISMVYSFDSAEEPSRRRSQYFEMLGNRAMYRDGWMASTTPRRMPWRVDYQRPDYRWELYHVATDFSQAHDLGREQPEMLEQLRHEFERVAGANRVLPVDDRFLQRFSPVLRPSAFSAGGRFVFYPDAMPLPAQSFPDLRTDWRVTAHVRVLAAGATAPIVVRGDRFGGWGLFVQKGRPHLVYRLSHLDRHTFQLRRDSPLPPGEYRLGVRVVPVGDDRHRLTLAVDGKEIGAGLPLSQLAFSRVETGIGRQGKIRMMDLEATAGVEVRRVVVEQPQQ